MRLLRSFLSYASLLAAATALAPVSVGCGLHSTHHTVLFRDPGAVSVLIHPPGPKTGELSLGDDSAGAGEAVSFADPDETQPPWTLRALRGDIGEVSLEFRLGESLLSGFELIGSAGLLDGRALMDSGVYTSGDLTVVRDPNNLVWTRLGYIPTAPSARQDGEPDWRRVAARMESGGPAAVSLVTSVDNIRLITRRTEVSWEVPALLVTLGAVMIAASIPLFVEAGRGTLTTEDQALVLTTGTIAAAFGLLGVGVGTAGFLARDYYEELVPDTLPVQQPKGVKASP